MRHDRVARLRRLAEELDEAGLRLADDVRGGLLLDEIDRALRPPVHERRVPTSGVIVEPTTPSESWAAGTDLEITRGPLTPDSLAMGRRFADGLSSWVARWADGRDEWVLFDRPSGSERDLVVIAEVMGATIVQRHPSGSVRVVGPFGVLRWEGLTWHHEPPIATWIERLSGPDFVGDAEVLEAMLEFAVHDLGSLGIGTLLVYRPDASPAPPLDERLPTPPPLWIREPSHLAPLRHALTHVDGAALFDAGGTLRLLGARLVPSGEAEEAVAPLGGTRHTSARRYSYDDPTALVVVVSEDGPVTVLRNGEVLGRSPRDA